MCYYNNITYFWGRSSDNSGFVVVIPVEKVGTEFDVKDCCCNETTNGSCLWGWGEGYCLLSWTEAKLLLLLLLKL